MQDPMHVLLEGIARTEIRCLLPVCIIRLIYFTLKELNRRIMNFAYSKDKPQVFDSKAPEDGGSLIQTAASIKTLLTLQPCLIGDKIPVDDEHWQHVIRLLQNVMLEKHSLLLT